MSDEKAKLNGTLNKIYDEMTAYIKHGQEVHPRHVETLANEAYEAGVKEAHGGVVVTKKTHEVMQDLLLKQGDSLVDEYMVGMYNGMELMLATVEDRETRYVTTSKINEGLQPNDMVVVSNIINLPESKKGQYGRIIQKLNEGMVMMEFRATIGKQEPIMFTADEKELTHIGTFTGVAES